MKTKNNVLHPLIKALDELIATAKSAKLKETAALLRIARLDLLMRVYGIKPDELELLTFAMAKAGLPAKLEPSRKKRPKLN